MNMKVAGGIALMGGAAFTLVTPDKPEPRRVKFVPIEESAGGIPSTGNNLPNGNNPPGGEDGSTPPGGSQPPGASPDGLGGGTGVTTGTTGRSNNGVANFNWSNQAMDGSLAATANALQNQIGGKSSSGDCAAFVGAALSAGNTGTSYPGVNASSYGGALSSQGYTRLNITNPYDAPAGAVIVYSGGTYGHVEMRTSDGGFVSDYYSTNARSDAGTRTVTGIYYK